MILYHCSVGDIMSSRMDKYYESDNVVGSRIKKNEQLYESINDTELENINLTSNAHVIGDNDSNIDVEKIKEMLEKKYKEQPKKDISLKNTEDAITFTDPEEETKEYDINAILEKARNTKDTEDYDVERLKKIHDTQYDILKSLDIEKETSKVTSNKEDLMNLIDVINEKEKTRELNPLDILTDLKGSDNTVVLDGINEEVQKQELKDVVKEEVKKEIDKSFYTNSLSFTKSDFDDFNDLKEDIESNKILVKVLLAIVIVALIVGIIFLVNGVFHLGWF